MRNFPAEPASDWPLRAAVPCRGAEAGAVPRGRGVALRRAAAGRYGTVRSGAVWCRRERLPPLRRAAGCSRDNGGGGGGPLPWRRAGSGALPVSRARPGPPRPAGETPSGTRPSPALPGPRASPGPSGLVPVRSRENRAFPWSCLSPQRSFRLFFFVIQLFQCVNR